MKAFFNKLLTSDKNNNNHKQNQRCLADSLKKDEKKMNHIYFDHRCTNNKLNINDRLFMNEIYSGRQQRLNSSSSRQSDYLACLSNTKCALESPETKAARENQDSHLLQTKLVELNSFIKLNNYTEMKNLLDDLMVIVNDTTLMEELVDLKCHLLLNDILVRNEQTIMAPRKKSRSWRREDTLDQIFLSVIYILNQICSTQTNWIFSIKSPYDLRRIHKLYEFIGELGSVSLFIFIKVLSACIHPPDPNDVQTIQKSIEIKNTQYPLFQINHCNNHHNLKALLLNAPKLIEKTCLLLEKSTNPKWIPPSLRQNNGFTNGGDWDSLDSYVPMHFNNDHILMIFQELNLDSEGIEPSTYLKRYTNCVFQTELLVFLYGIMNGSRKLQTLLLIQKLGFIPTLYKIINSIDWTKSYSDDYNPFHIQKIQSLRYIILFFDVEVMSILNDCLLIPQYEKDYINGLTKMDQSKTYWLHSIYQSYLKSKHIDKERTFLMCCIQSSLRMSNIQVKQYYVNFGLMDSLYQEIIEQKQQFYQMNFDLLGELLKNNSPLYHDFTKRCTADPSSFKLLQKIVMENIIDANVFLRAILLTHSELRSSNQLKFQDNEYILFDYIVRQHRNNILETLIDSLSVETLHLENLCCLNTFLFILHVSKDFGYFDESIVMLKLLCRNSTAFTQNFLGVFALWKSFYDQNSRDIFSLEYTSKLKFHEIANLVTMIEEQFTELNV
ncbi:hypothetical protein PPL_05408 [Heterostelium album PN500]|uniref:Uncharacterized protein n=1 Tax=Heterostelium pallidum (strain ATCC 26659 / Pp 5 / PN500) TaxID=670386 RepID=D3BA35_HETP5|nr:hypothetical protein PPL_05408 [Heterostelium album PN500]EFA81422.1 hypothetical protein PPL_05408 [Heterostelium album PN500]|eukprot:XP_020433540.1 hypothetical protein PPL_05408 [Heterostelium album PN500]